MAQPDDLTDTILIVDDEEPVRRTFREWLAGAGLDCRILAVPDTESALVQANQHTIDLAVLDWHLGDGRDGLQLLEDLYEFNPDVVAIMVTGYANKATPLDAMRKGVRDYLDKNQELTRDAFLKAVRRQLEHIRPAKRERRLHASLVAFRESVEKVLPLVQSAAALNDPVPLPEAVASLFRFLRHTTRARDGVLLVRRYASDEPEACGAYDADGRALEVQLVPFARSVAASAVSLQEPCAMARLEEQAGGAFELQPFERGRTSLLAAPLAVAPGVHVVLELFDKQAGGAAVPFTDDDVRLVRAAADFGAELLRGALAHRQTHQVLFDAVAVALGASESVAATLRGTSSTQRLEQPPPVAVMDSLREGLSATTGAAVGADDCLRLAEAIRVLSLRHGPPAVQHCVRLVEGLRQLLDQVTGA
jgi:ActR/RegA family two-component response regulator